jgi:choline monooxygenase
LGRVVIVDAPGLSAALAAGATLPAAWYSDPAIQRLELDRIFGRTWQVAGRTELVAEPGSYFASYAGHIPVVVVREHSGRLNAFVNVCRHRGHLVVEGCGQRQRLQCPYHAWTYRLDGSLYRAPRSEREPGFDAAGLSLVPLKVDTWGPVVFVNPDLDAAPLADTLGELSGLIAGSGLELNALRFRERSEWGLAANWKIGLENYLECYHCPVAHPGFSKLIDVDPDSYVLEARELVFSQFGPTREISPNGRTKPPYVPEGPVRQAQYHFVWPNLTINIDPGPANLSVDVWRPAGPGRTVGFTEWFFGEDVSAEAAQEIIDFSNQVGSEDDALVESVQRGLGSEALPHGRLLLSSEHLIQRFQRLVFDSLTA